MKRCLKKSTLIIFLFNLLLLVATARADVLKIESTASSNDATSVYAQDNLNEIVVEEITKPDMWYGTNSWLWYYFENNWSTTRTGWFVDPRDGQTYYLRPENGIMAVGWTRIGDSEYYFYDNKEAENGWFEVGGGFYEKSLNGQPS